MACRRGHSSSMLGTAFARSAAGSRDSPSCAHFARVPATAADRAGPWSLLAPDAPETGSSGALAKVDDALVQACNAAVGNRILPGTDCPGSLVRLDVDTMWNGSADAFADMGGASSYSVLGPLAWTSHGDLLPA